MAVTAGQLSAKAQGVPGRSFRGEISAAALASALLWAICAYSFPAPSLRFLTFFFAVIFLAPAPLLLIAWRAKKALSHELAQAQEEAGNLKRELETVRYRTARLREELAAADSQARLSHQLTSLGRFTAGFLHEFNNPLAILTSRIEVVLEERKGDLSLCADLNQMLKEARYMAKISGTLLPALTRERGAQPFSPCAPGETLREIAASLEPAAAKHGVKFAIETADAPTVNLPEHVLAECLRVLVSNALDVLQSRDGGTIWLRIEPYHNPGARVLLRVEDNGPGVPEALRNRLFEPFSSSGKGRDRLGLGLFVAASLLDLYDGFLKYEPRAEGGARFTLELPPTRFTKEQPYHWFVQEAPL